MEEIKEWRAQSAQPKSAQEITMKVYVKQYDDRTAFTLGTTKREIGTIGKDPEHIGKYSFCWSVGRYGYKDNLTYPEAVEFLSERICTWFTMQYGINVEFVKE